MKKLLFILVVCFSISADIGGWDSSNCILSIAPAAWANGNDTTKNSGLFATFPGAPYTATLTDMLSGFGYNSDSGALVFDGTNDQIITNYNPQFTDAMKLTCEAWFYYVSDATTQVVVGNADDVDNRFMFQMQGNDVPSFFFENATVVDRAVSSVVLSDGLHHMVAIKDGIATLKIYIDGAEVAGYSSQDAFGLGTFQFTDNIRIGHNNAGSTFFGPSNMYTINIYDDAISTARIAAKFALGKDMGLAGYSAGADMALDDPVSITSIVPATSTVKGGISAIISGSGFQPGGSTPTVSIGSFSVTVNSNNDTSITITIPEGSKGAFDLIVTDSLTSSDTSSNAFVYTSAVNRKEKKNFGWMKSFMQWSRRKMRFN